MSDEGRLVATAAARVRNGRDWHTKYANRLLVTDFLVLVWVVFGVQIAWFGLDAANVSFRGSAAVLAVSYTSISVVFIAAWMLMLGVYGTRGFRVLGTGPEEYKLIANGALRLFGLAAIFAYLFHVDLARGYILVAFPFGTAVLCFSRWIWRQWLNAQRLSGGYSSRVLLVGSQASAGRLARDLSRQSAAGYLVVGACLAGGTAGSMLPGTAIPVLGGLDDLHEALDAVNADTVVVTGSDKISSQRMRELSWSLEPGQYHLVVAPSLTDIGGPRIHTRPVAGLPLIHVETPRYDGRKLLAKRALDLVGSGVLLVLLSPVFLVLAITVKVTSPGPVLYKQERIGLNGDQFHMHKFRSMRVDADAELDGLLKAQGRSDKPLFKIQNDPRITPIGHILRKYSLDEFPQLINVFRGDMSLVGPRPQRDGEVTLYDDAARRRLLLKPGMSGLWQIGGRSTLSWEDAIRLDLYYVENWSLAGDLIILWRTIKAVLVPGNDAH